MRSTAQMLGIVGLLCISGCGKHHDRHEIKLDEGIRRTEAGEFGLIVMTEDLVSFQSGPTGKWQYYYDATNREGTFRAVQSAIAVATNAGHYPHFEDISDFPHEAK